MALTCYSDSTHERFLSESSRPYTLAYRVYEIHCRSKYHMNYFDYIESMAHLFLLTVDCTSTIEKLQVVYLQTYYYRFFIQASKSRKAFKALRFLFQTGN
jgi:hypothetical protein